MKSIKRLVVLVVALTLTGVPLILDAHVPHECPEGFPDAPAISKHIDQDDIDNGNLKFRAIVRAGGDLLTAFVNKCDGQGRPGTTGHGLPRNPEGQPRFTAVSGPSTSHCLGCHNLPRSGGAGDFVTNPFGPGEFFDPIIESISSEFTNERNPPSLFGVGPIEMLAREMSADLQAQAEALGGPSGSHTLTTKGVDFEVTIQDGKVVASRGVDTDLVIKPLRADGAVRSVRFLTALVFNLHFGMQPTELAGVLEFIDNPDADWDLDGMTHELTVGDITAATIWQAQLGTPGRKLPRKRAKRSLIDTGEKLFEEINCTSCHVPAMRLNSRLYVDEKTSFSFDMTRKGEKPRLERDGNGGAIVRAYTDFKRHNLCDATGAPDPIRFFCNEQLAGPRPDQDERPGQEFFITTKLWAAGSPGPYGHRGDLTTLTEAILMHGGEARASRDAFVTLPVAAQASIINFLKTLQVL